MTLLRNTLHFPRFGKNLIGDYFIDVSISRYFWKFSTDGLQHLRRKYIFVFESVTGWNTSTLQKYRAYFKRAYYYIRIYFFTINSIFRLPKDCFSKYHLTYFTGSDLGLIILKWNSINEVAVTDPIVRNHCIAKNF